MLVVLAEDNLLVREGVRGVLAADPDITVAAACADAEELRSAIATHSPQVVVTDIHMPPGFSDEGIQVARELRTQRPEVGVVVLSSRDDPQHALDLLESGCAGRAYLLKERVAEPGQLGAGRARPAEGAGLSVVLAPRSTWCAPPPGLWSTQHGPRRPVEAGCW